jgi:hypothetical protein
LAAARPWYPTRVPLTEEMLSSPGSSWLSRLACAVSTPTANEPRRKQVDGAGTATAVRMAEPLVGMKAKFTEPAAVISTALGTSVPVTARVAPPESVSSTPVAMSRCASFAVTVGTSPSTSSSLRATLRVTALARVGSPL